MAPRFSDRFLDDLRASITVLEYARRNYKIEKSGSNFVLSENRSLTITPSKNMWYDFGGGHTGNKGGDVISFERTLSGCSFEDAVERIAQTVGMQIPGKRKDLPLKDEGPVGPEPPLTSYTNGNNGAHHHPPRSSPREVTKTYDYVDPDGGLLYQTCRIEWTEPDGKKMKTFAQRRYGPNREWAWGLDEGLYLRSGINGEWYRATEQRLEKWRGAPQEKLEKVAHTLYRFDELREEMAQDPDERKTIFVCYLGDTEVLTPQGWVRFDTLDPASQVAQWQMRDGSIDFVKPIAHQRFDYSGKMINISSTWCDLMVTPDHRQPTYRKGCKKKVRRAEDITAPIQLPIAGNLIWSAASSPTVDQARLIAAWLADGVNHTKGKNVSWCMKKERKKIRIRQLLTLCNVPWRELEYPSTLGWTSFIVRRCDLDWLWSYTPNKSWEWSALKWTQEAREASIFELQYWDGDGAHDRSIRYFTADQKSADVVCALAACTGWGASIRLDARRGSRNYIVNLNHKRWRHIAKNPTESYHSGLVYCCTVPSSFLIVRRNGKVTISGNCEGEKDVSTLEEFGLFGTTNSGGAKSWQPHFADEFSGADVVILLDNDKAGRERGHMIAGSLRLVAKRVRVLSWPDHWNGCPEKADVTDWRDQAGGTYEKFCRIIDKLPTWTPERPQSSFGAMMFQDLDKPGKELSWLVKGVITEGGVSIWYGQWGSGKSFLIVDCCLTIARGVGMRWGGSVVKPGLVIYQAGEGELGLKQRLRAYRKYHHLPEDDDLPFLSLTSQIDIHSSDADTDKLIIEIKAWAAYYDEILRLVVIDTLNAATPGADENSGRDIGPVLKRARKIAIATGAHVALVDHVPKDGNSPRGWSGKMGNIDSAIEVTKTNQMDRQLSEDGQRWRERPIHTWKVTKQKDAEARKGFEFILPQVLLGVDSEGDKITSCIVQPITGQQANAPVAANRDEVPRGWAKVNSANEDLIRCLVRALRKHGRSAPTGIEAPMGEPVITISEWQAELLELYVGHEEVTPALKERLKKRVQRACKGWDAEHANLVGKHKEFIWRTGRKVHMIDPAPPPDRSTEPDEPNHVLAPGESMDEIAKLLI